MEVVEVHELGGDENNRDPHVFKPVKGGAKIKVFDIGTSVSGCRGGNDAIPHDLGGSEVGGPGGEFVGIVDEIAAGGDADSVWIFVLQPMIDDDSCVCDGAVLGNVGNFLVSGMEVRGSGCGAPAMMTSGCLNSSSVGLEVGDLVGARLPISMG